MGFSSLHRALSRRQCALLVLCSLFAAWLLLLYKYSQLRAQHWHAVAARVIEMQGTKSQTAKLLLYEFQNQPYVAMQSAIPGLPSDAVPGSQLALLVNESEPHEPSYTLEDASKARLLLAGALVLFSGVALYLSIRLIETLRIEAERPQSVGELDSLLQEFGGNTGWSDAFVELINLQEHSESTAPTRASGGSGPTQIG